MYARQGAFAGEGFPLTKAACKTKPSWGIVATEDNGIRPEAAEKMYTRSNTKFVKIKGSCGVYLAGGSCSQSYH